MTLTIITDTLGIIVTPNAHPDQHRTWRAGAKGSRIWSLAKTDGLYDLTISSAADPSFVRRLAGRLEFPRKA
jgi:predicted benzoate:H+ symporter BenE